MSRAPIMFTVNNGRLSPGDVYAEQQISELPNGTYSARFSRMTAKFKTEREGLRGLWFAGLKLLSENTEDIRYDTPAKAYHNIRIDLGFVRPRWRVDGSVEMVPMSTSDESMDDEEMIVLLERAATHCVGRFGFDPFQTWKDQQEAMKP